MKPDIIVVWPRNCDYPLWRQFIRENRHRFNEIIIGFMETNVGRNYMPFIKEAMQADYVHFIEPMPVPAGQDWRNVIVNNCLLHSYNAEWIWFTEQDFIITHPDLFFDDIESHMETYDVMAVYQEHRMHPCSIFARRSALNKTRKDFGIIPNISDHFSKFQADIERIGLLVAPITDFYYHLNGLSHNMYLLYQNQVPNYEIERFCAYLEDCLQVSVPLQEDWVTMIKNFLEIRA